MHSRRHTAAIALLAIALTASPAVAANKTPAPPKLGGVCLIKGKQVKVGGAKLQCKLHGKTLRWSRATALPTPGPTAYDQLAGTITVFAAASLTEAFEVVASQFEQVHRKVHVTLSFGPSSGLATQIMNGAPADVFASASGTNMQQLANASLVANPKTFARNRMIIVTPPGNPKRITGITDLAKADVKIALCQVQVPCGSAAKQVFANARISVTPVTYEVDVKSVLTKVVFGEVDAGLVYVTDARSAGSTIASIVIPADVNVETVYPVARLVGSSNPDAAQAFIDFVLGDRGAAALAAVGFTVL